MKTPFPEQLRQTAQKACRLLFGEFRKLDVWHDVVRNNYELGLECLKKGRIADAKLRFGLVVWLDANHADGWAYLGAAHSAAGNTARARQCWQKALKLKPDHPQAKEALAKAATHAA